MYSTLGPSDTHSNVVEEKPVETQPADVKVFKAKVFVESVLIIAVVVLSVLLLIVILSRERLRKSAFNQLVVSLAVGCFTFSIVLRPGTIIDEDKHQEMSKSYCGLYQILQKMEWMFFPLAFWMVSIERLLALHKPETYTKRTNKVARVFLIGFPWGFAFAFAVLSTFILGEHVVTRYGPYPDDPYFDEMSHLVQVNCMMIYNYKAAQAARILMFVFGCIIPILSLLITSIALIVVYCKRRSVKVYDDTGELLVSTGSIVLCTLMNVSAMLVVLDGEISEVYGDLLGRTRYPNILHLHWSWAMVQLLFVLLALFVLPDVRRGAASICCCCCDLSSQDEKRALLTQPKGTQTADSEKSPEEK